MPNWDFQLMLATIHAEIYTCLRAHKKAKGFTCSLACKPFVASVNNILFRWFDRPAESSIHHHGFLVHNKEGLARQRYLYSIPDPGYIHLWYSRWYFWMTFLRPWSPAKSARNGMKAGKLRFWDLGSWNPEIQFSKSGSKLVLQHEKFTYCRGRRKGGNHWKPP